jgi:endonuclease G
MHPSATFYKPFRRQGGRNSAASFLWLLLCLAGCRQTEVAPKKAADQVPNVHLTLGNPSRATADLVQANNYLIQKPQFALS